MRSVALRVGQLAIVLFLVTLFTALLLSLLPGDPAEVIIPFGDESDRVALREELNLDDPLPARYADWLGGFVTGDLGNYYRQAITEKVSTRVAAAAPVSLQLMVYAQALALVIAIPVAVVAARRAGGLFDRLTNTSAFAVLAVPNFVLALLLSYFVGVKLGWLPPQGYVRVTEDFGEHIRSMILPSISLAAGQVAVYMRLLRTDLVATLQEDFVLMAKAKGLSDRRVMWRHALRPSSLTLLTVAGLNVGTLVGGALIIEIIFTLPGIGQLIVQAIGERQYVAVQSIVALIAVGYVLVNVAVDLLYSALDPRIRHARG